MGQLTSRNVQAAPPAPTASASISNKLALGAGCYWGTEKYVCKNFQAKFPGSIKKAAVGFMPAYESVRIPNPTYRQVCSGINTHIEVLYIELNEPEKHFEELIRFFFQFHDPTTSSRQGNDRGFQYASWIFCYDKEQIDIAEKVRDELQVLLDQKAIRCYEQKKVTTKITPLRQFTKAEEGHQQYLAKNPMAYCNHRIRFKQWPAVKQNESKEESSSVPNETN